MQQAGTEAAAAATDGDRAGIVACWSCRGPVPVSALFCATCRAVQPPAAVDHFSRLGVTAAYDLEPSVLDAAYFAAQRQLHPDRFATRSGREKALSGQQAAALNDAYETLKQPLTRAAYLIEQAGFTAAIGEAVTVQDPVLLMEQMELREALSQAETPAEAGAFADQAGQAIEQCNRNLSSAFADNDIAAAQRLVLRLKYLIKLADEARDRRARLAAG